MTRTTRRLSLSDFRRAENLVAAARARLERYPQYADHFQSVTLVRITRDVKTKLGVAFAKHDYAIVDESAGRNPWEGKFTIVWSSRNGVHTSVPTKYVSIVEGD